MKPDLRLLRAIILNFYIHRKGREKASHDRFPIPSIGGGGKEKKRGRGGEMRGLPLEGVAKDTKKKKKKKELLIN